MRIARTEFAIGTGRCHDHADDLEYSNSLIGSQKVITAIQGLMLFYEALEPSLSPTKE
jgi:hypothetical protein